MNKPAAIYARVSSDRQKENHTIASQTAALIEYAQKNGYSVPPEWVFQDEGYSGAILVRPGLEALRDLAAEGQIAAALIYSPDRLSRKYAYQVLLSEELSRCGVELIFLKAPAGTTPEDRLLVQFQGMIAEYERAQIAERCRRALVVHATCDFSVCIGTEGSHVPNNRLTRDQATYMPDTVPPVNRSRRNLSRGLLTNHGFDIV
jgi:DNA invertase Pin-like site-specific DNA recombinase